MKREIFIMAITKCRNCKRLYVEKYNLRILMNGLNPVKTNSNLGTVFLGRCDYCTRKAAHMLLRIMGEMK